MELYLEFKGPCPHGEVLIPVNRTSAKCGPDACQNKEPLNGRIISKYASYEESREDENEVFKFTYNDTCYMTETEGFCGAGKVVRFLPPYKSPFCVPADYDNCQIQINAGPKASSSPNTIPCPSGYKVDGVRNFCVRVIIDEFLR